MSQEDVFKVFEEYPDRWFQRSEIHNELKKRGKKIGLCTVTMNISKLYKNNDIVRKQNPVRGWGQRGYVYKLND